MSAVEAAHHQCTHVRPRREWSHRLAILKSCAGAQNPHSVELLRSLRRQSAGKDIAESSLSDLPGGISTCSAYWILRPYREHDVAVVQGPHVPKYCCRSLSERQSIFRFLPRFHDRLRNADVRIFVFQFSDTSHFRFRPTVRNLMVSVYLWVLKGKTEQKTTDCQRSSLTWCGQLSHGSWSTANAQRQDVVR